MHNSNRSATASGPASSFAFCSTVTQCLAILDLRSLTSDLRLLIHAASHTSYIESIVPLTERRSIAMPQSAHDQRRAGSTKTEQTPIRTSFVRSHNRFDLTRPGSEVLIIKYHWGIRLF